MEDNQFTNLLAVLNEYGNAFRNLYQDKLIASNKIASGDLLNSIEYRVTADGTTYEVILSLENYWKYIEGGIKPEGAFNNPGWKAFPAILEWVQVKPVVPRPDDKGRVPTPRQLAGAITHKIVTEGIAPKPLMAQTYEELNAYYRPRIAAAFKADTLHLLKLSAFGGISSQLNRQ